jgi:ABC-type multidrug transport system fused ATPase/permease subunit
LSSRADSPDNRARAKAIPMWDAGEIPAHRQRQVEDDDSGFKIVVALLLRSWPYIRPQLLGRWWNIGEGVEDNVAETVASQGYNLAYAPFLVALVAAGLPMSGYVPATFEWPMNLLYYPAIAMVAGMFFMTFSSGRPQVIAALIVVLGGILANVVGTYVIDGYPDSVYAAAVSVTCGIGWAVQYRVADGRIHFRVRTRTHLLGFYGFWFAERIVIVTVAVLVADLLNQSILQAEPLAPGLAALLGLDALAQGTLNELTDEQRRGLIPVYLGIFLGGAVIQRILQGAREFYNMWIMQQINQDLRVALLHRWHQLSMSYHSDHRTGDSVFRIYQDSAMVTTVVSQVTGIILAIGSYYTCVALVALLSPWIGLLAGLLLVPALLWSRFAMPRMRVQALMYRETTSDVTSTVQESFGAIKLIKAFGTQGRMQQRLEEDSIAAMNAGFRVRNLIAVVTIVMFTIASCFMIGGEFTMAWWTYQSNPTFARDLIALVGISFVVWNLGAFSWTRDQYRESSGDIRKLLNDWMVTQDMAMGLRRVFDILDIEPDVQDKPDAAPMTGFREEIRYDNVRFAYEPDRPVLDGVSFTAKPGTVTAIIGPTGCGKSTLTSLLIRLFDPTLGAISIDGKDLREYTVESVRSNIAVALQENILFAMSVGDNIRYAAPNATDGEVREAARVAAMDDYISGLPHGLDTVLSDRGGKLSTGQKQRLSIARAIVRNTPILILDEPTAALDAATEHQVMSNLAEWVAGSEDERRAIFLITHRISTIRRADNILYLDEGKIQESGTHDELMQIENGRYRAFVEAESSLTGAGTGTRHG